MKTYGRVRWIKRYVPVTGFNPNCVETVNVLQQEVTTEQDCTTSVWQEPHIEWVDVPVEEESPQQH